MAQHLGSDTGAIGDEEGASLGSHSVGDPAFVDVAALEPDFVAARL